METTLCRLAVIVRGRAAIGLDFLILKIPVIIVMDQAKRPMIAFIVRTVVVGGIAINVVIVGKFVFKKNVTMNNVI